MDLKALAAKAAFKFNKNSPVILTVVAVAGVGGTAYLAARAGWRSREYFGDPIEPIYEGLEGKKNMTKVVWKEYIPPAILGVGTAACIVGSTRVGLKRAGAAQAALLLAERTYSEYRDKVVEQYGESKDRTIREEIAKERVNAGDIPSADILVTGPGNVLSCELYTGRYFACDMETLRRASNTINSHMIRHDSATLEDFYDLIGLSYTTHSQYVGWRSDKVMELEFTTVLTEDGRPCLAFDYNYTKQLYGGAE